MARTSGSFFDVIPETIAVPVSLPVTTDFQDESEPHDDAEANVTFVGPDTSTFGRHTPDRRKEPFEPAGKRHSLTSSSESQSPGTVFF